MQNFQSKILQQYKDIFYTFTTKEDGNIAFHVGDRKSNVIHKHQKLAKKHNYDYTQLVYMQQIHSNIVKNVTQDDDFTKPFRADGLITDVKNKPLMVMVADCSPILFYDPIQRVVAVAHAGRAGAFENIVANVIRKFTQEYHSDTKDIVVSVGAAICPSCYEVNETIKEEAKERGMLYAIKEEKNRLYLDIRAILYKELRESGLLNEHIEISPICSKCHPDFYSYREDKSCGRFAGIIALI
jgi:YfiH family protein